MKSASLASLLHAFFHEWMGKQSRDPRSVCLKLLQAELDTELIER